MPIKRKASQDNIAESKVETRSARRRKIKETGRLPPDPLFSALPWDCASLIFDYLELPDLARCEQVSQSWKTFVQRWMVARGHYLHLPESLRLDFGAAKTMERQAAMVKWNVVHLQRYNKIASGRASSVRVIQNAQSLDVNGDFAAWVVRHRLYGQHLGFQADGSPYRTRYWDLSRNCNISGNTIVHVRPGGYVVVRVSNHSGYLDRIVSISTGTHLWRRASEAGVPFTDWPEIRGIGATRLYSVQREEGSMHQAYLLVHELATGTLLYRSHVRDYPRIREPPNSFCVRRIGNREVLVVFSVPPTETSPESPDHVHPGQKKLEGFLVINPEDGSTLQSFDAPFCQDKHRWVSQHYVESRIMPWTETEGVFAVFCRHMTETDWVFKVEAFSANADGTFHRIRTNIMTKDREDRADSAIGVPGREVLDPQIDPFHSLCLDLAQRCSVPRITRMETCHQADLGNREDIPRHASVQVDRWLREGKEQRITMPPMTKEGTGRRWLALRWPWLESATYRLRSAGMNRLVVEPDGLRVDDKDHVHTLFDFEFRRPCNLNLESRLR